MEDVVNINVVFEGAIIAGGLLAILIGGVLIYMGDRW